MGVLKPIWAILKCTGRIFLCFMYTIVLCVSDQNTLISMATASYPRTLRSQHCKRGRYVQEENGLKLELMRQNLGAWIEVLLWSLLGFCLRVGLGAPCWFPSRLWKFGNLFSGSLKTPLYRSIWLFSSCSPSPLTLPAPSNLKGWGGLGVLSSTWEKINFPTE